MAKDDYFVLEGKILVFLYRKLKGSSAKDAEEYLQPHTKDFPISEEYFRFVIGSLAEEGYISGYKIVKAWGGGIRVLTREHVRLDSGLCAPWGGGMRVLTPFPGCDKINHKKFTGDCIYYVRAKQI